MITKFLFLLCFILLIILFIILFRKNIETYGSCKSSSELEEIYKFFIPLFKKLDITIFYGTLLGYVRENNFINKDDDITTVRASIPMYILSEYIRENTDIKVIFSGEGSDEVGGGYLYFHRYPSDEEFHMECCRLIKDLSYFDCLRSDKTTSGNGLEVRCPFLDKEFIEYYLSIPIEYRVPKNRIEKWFLREVFDGKDILPKDILWRVKEAFSDGVIKKTESWFEILKKFTKNESGYYKEIFQKYYRGCEKTVPYYWMPKWNDGVTDPSARCLS